MTVRPLGPPLDYVGRWVNLGTVGHRLTWQGNIDGANAWPAWLASYRDGAATAPTWNDPATTAGGMRLATAATVGSTVEIRGPLITLSQFDQVELTLEGVTFDAASTKDTVDFDFGWWSDDETVGAKMLESGNMSSARFKALPITGTEDTLDTQNAVRSQAGSGSTIGQGTANYTLRLRRNLVESFPAGTVGTVPSTFTAHMHLLDGEQHISGCEMDTVVFGQVRPRIRLRNTAAAVHALSLLRIELAWRTNRVTTN